MIRFISVGLAGWLAATLLFPTSARAETPHEILTRKGLKRSGLRYILVDIEQRQNQFNRLTQALQGVDPGLQRLGLEGIEGELSLTRARSQKITKIITLIINEIYYLYKSK